MKKLSWRVEEERGAAAVELAILGFTLILVVTALVIAGRIGGAQNAVQSAATAAAREASLARTETIARVNGDEAVTTSLQNNGIRCASTRTDLNLAGFTTALGTPGIVTATVTCTVDVSAVSVPGLPGSFTVTRSSQSPVDPYRQR